MSVGTSAGVTWTRSVSCQSSALHDIGHLSQDQSPVHMVMQAATHPAVSPERDEAEETSPYRGRAEIADVRLVGRIAAGNPILAEESIEDSFPLPKQLVGEGTLFLLRVSGDSMINAQILDGDWVIVRQQPTAENGEIVAALLDGEATIKTLKRANGHIWLIPQNPAYTAFAGDEAIILGKIVALLRRFTTR